MSTKTDLDIKMGTFVMILWPLIKDLSDQEQEEFVTKAIKDRKFLREQLAILGIN